MSGENYAMEVVQEAGFFEDRNRKHRRFMEANPTRDCHNLIDKFGNGSMAYFGVYDGHGGSSASKFCEEHLPKSFEEELKDMSDGDFENNDKVRDAFTRAIQKTDAAMKPTIPSAGACVVVALVKKFGEKKGLFVANLGDSRALLLRGDTPVRLTKDHKGSDPEEAAYIESQKGFVDPDGRVNAVLMVSRAMGDHHMKGKGKDFIRTIPHFQATELTQDDSHLVLACDGLWDVVNDEEALAIVRGQEASADMKSVARALLAAAIRAGSTDNVTVVVVKF